MEELAHVHLGHTPSRLTLIDGELAVRSFDRGQEDEAYSVGGAALISRAHLDYALNKAITRDALARSYGVSTALIAFRERETQVQLCG
jgi:hypothetical protein